ncbi:MAG: 30S ribosome-binding factor RbfA [bacterium]|nr:30S ribosome-binding factor RbfA [bacterium]
MAKTNSGVRQARVAGEIIRILSRTMERERSTELTGLVSIANIELSHDYSVAKVFYSVFGSPIDVSNAQAHFKRHTGKYRTAIARELRMRSVPELLFKYDPSSERAERIDRILDKIQSDDVPPVEEDPVA